MINDLKDLKKLLALCRAQGVTEITLGTVAFKLGDLPLKAGDVAEDDEDQYASFPQGTLTPEQLMFYSAGGHPEDDPAKGNQ